MKVFFNEDMLYKLQEIARSKYGEKQCDDRDKINGHKCISDSLSRSALIDAIDSAYSIALQARAGRELDQEEELILSLACGRSIVSMSDFLWRFITLYPHKRMHLHAGKIARTLLSNGYKLASASNNQPFEVHVFEKVKEELANEQMASRISRDAWEEAALSYCSDKEFVTSEEVLRYIKPDISMHNNMDKSRVRGILQLNGWEYRQIRSGDDRGKRGFFKGDK